MRYIRTFALFSGCVVPSVVLLPAQAEIVTDGTVGQATSLSGPNYEISAGLGQIEGNNLFHSFSRFNLSSSESANFSGPGNIQNIIGRVTGGEQSFIDGTISSSIQGANLFLLNPSGLLFGENASINITGSFYASTADYLALGANGRFDATNIENTTLSVAAPSAFGFVDASVAEINVNGSRLHSNHDISLIGGDITVSGRQESSSIFNDETSTIQSDGGNINLISTQSSGELTIGNIDESIANFETLGEISIDNGALVVLKDSPEGSIKIRAGQLVIENSRIASLDSGDNNDVSSGNEKNSIDIALSGDLRIHSTDSADYINNSGILSVSSDQTADANILISTRDLSLGKDSEIASYAFGNQDSSDITLNTRNIYIDGSNGRSAIASISAGSGNSGEINISAHNILVSGGARSAGIHTQASPINDESAANSGDININANKIELLQSGQIGSSATNGSGTGGTININSNSIYIAGLHPDGNWPGIYTNSSDDSNGGNIIINTGLLELDEFGVVGAQSYGSGHGGNITIIAEDISVSHGGVISTTGFEQGDAGDITIDAENITLKGPSPNLDPDDYIDDYTGIFAAGGPLGSAPGDISITTGALEILDGAQIDNSTANYKHGGSIDITADYIRIAGYDEGTGNHSHIRAATVIFQSIDLFAIGEGGDINITADDIQLSDGGQISVYSDSHGDGGNLNIKTNHLSMTDEAAILATSTLDGDAGNIQIDVAKTLQLTDSRISTASMQAHGGDISIARATQTYLRNSEITTSVLSSSGNGGDINMTGELVVLSSSNVVATANAGMGGNITIDAETLLTTPDSEISAASDESVSGNILLSSQTDAISRLDQLPTESSEVSKYFHNECNADKNLHSSFFVNINSLRIKNLDYVPSILAINTRQNLNNASTYWQSDKIPLDTPNEYRNSGPKIVLSKLANVDCGKQ